MSDPQPVEIDEAEIERLIERARQGQLDVAQQQRIVPLLKTLVWLQRTLLETRISLAKLRKILFGKPTEKAPRKPAPPPDGSTDSSKNTSQRPNDEKDANRTDIIWKRFGCWLASLPSSMQAAALISAATLVSPGLDADWASTAPSVLWVNGYDARNPNGSDRRNDRRKPGLGGG